MHGPEECMGNIVELCAAHLYPDPKIYLGFTMCLSRDYKDIPQHDLVADCALEHGIDLAKLNECAVSEDGGFAVGMLRDSVRRSTAVSSSFPFLYHETYADKSSRLESRSRVPYESTRKYTAFVMEENGKIVRVAQASMISLLQSRSSIVLKGLKNIHPKLRSFPNCIM